MSRSFGQLLRLASAASCSLLAFCGICSGWTKFEMSTQTKSKSVRSIAADLHPAYFAMAMATGIVSVASQLRGMPIVAQALLWLNVVFYVVLWTLTLWRVFRFCDRVFA